jgi:hypothetical protein
MAAASNESQGLKIAVAAFVTLSVILIVTSYFLYSAYSQTEAQLAARSDDLAKAKRAQDDALNQASELSKTLGVKAEDFETAKTAISAHLKKIDERLNGVASKVNLAATKAQSAGATSQEIEDTKAKIQQLIQSYRTEPNKSYFSALDRFAEIFDAVAMLETELSFNYVQTRHDLEALNQVNKTQVSVHEKAANDKQADLLKEHDTHETQRQNLLSSVTRLQADNDAKASEIANLKSQLKQGEDEATRRQELANSIIREQRDRLAKTEVTLDRPDGHITYVDYERGEVQLDINRRMGAHPQMKMSVFDRLSPGIPTERPKGSIEILQVGDDVSVAKILKTNVNIEPIRVGDIVYSPAWSANEPTKFALIGKMDVNRDGKDDRAELKRMIEEAGGRVDYDLPPPDIGKESGKLTARIDWYVTDERTPLRDSFIKKNEATLTEMAQFDKKRGEVIKEARLSSIRPMPIGKLLTYLGYDYAAPIIGRSEAVDEDALRKLTAPRRVNQPNAKAGSQNRNAGTEGTGEMPENDAIPAPR